MGRPPWLERRLVGFMVGLGLTLYAVAWDDATSVLRSAASASILVSTCVAVGALFKSRMVRGLGGLTQMGMFTDSLGPRRQCSGLTHGVRQRGCRQRPRRRDGSFALARAAERGVSSRDVGRHSVSPAVQAHGCVVELRSTAVGSSRRDPVPDPGTAQRGTANRFEFRELLAPGSERRTSSSGPLGQVDAARSPTLLALRRRIEAGRASPANACRRRRLRSAATKLIRRHSGAGLGSHY
jgi:hypothetical protein